MDATQFAFIFCYLLCSFPLVFAILFLFGDVIKSFAPADLINTPFFSFFLLFGMAAIGIFVDSFRHCIEWIVEYRVKDLEDVSYELGGFPKNVNFPEPLNRKIHYDTQRRLLILSEELSNEDKDTLLNLSANRLYRRAINALFQKYLEKNKRKCAFWPRIHIEDKPRSEASTNPFSRELFIKKLDRFEARYFAAEGMMSFALSSILASMVYLGYHLYCRYQGIEYSSDKMGALKFATEFKTLAVPFCIIGAFFWCRDKAIFINEILGANTIQLYCKRRKWFFWFFLGSYILFSTSVNCCYGFFEDDLLTFSFLVSFFACVAFGHHLYSSKSTGSPLVSFFLYFLLTISVLIIRNWYYNYFPFQCKCN